MFEKLDFTPGRITFNNHILLENEIINNNNDALTEDMFQVEFSDNYIIDSGWHSGLGKFLIYIIKNNNWEEPVLRFECNSIQALNSKMQECIDFVKDKISY